MTFEVGDAVKGPASCKVVIITAIQEDVTTFVTLEELLLTGELGDIYENIPMSCLERATLTGVWKVAYLVYRQKLLEEKQSTTFKLPAGSKKHDRAMALIADKYKLDVDFLSSLILDLDAVGLISLN